MHIQRISFRKASLALSLTVGVVMLSGCIAAPLIVGGPAATTASVVTDRRTAGSIVSDEVVEKRVSYEIEQALGKSQPHHVTVTAYDGRVLLSGEINSLGNRKAVEQIATAGPDVRGVVNELAVMEPSSLSTRLSDSLLATRVRTSIVGNSKISLNQMKVVAERGIIYLMGLVTGDEAPIAAQTAAKISGVQKVITCFTIATREEIEQRMKTVEQNQPKED